MKKKINFLGRPDGLGNRFEELILLKIFQEKTGNEIVYHWNNLQTFRSDRKYDIRFSIEGIQIVELTKESLAQGLSKDYRNFGYTPTQEEFLFAASKIKPTFTVNQDTSDCVGLHIRRGDKIKVNPPPSEMTSEQSQYCIQKAFDFCRHENVKKIFLCGDCPEILSQLRDELSIDVVLGSDEYMDFFCLSQTQYILLASQISSFAFCASLVGNKTLYNFIDPKEMREVDRKILLRFNTKLVTYN